MADIYVDPKIERMLEEARKLEEERKKRVLERVDGRAQFAQNFQWLRYVVYLWAARLSFSLLGGVIPFGVGLIQHFYGGSSASPYTADLPTQSWRALLKEDFTPFAEFKIRERPMLIENVPVISEDSLAVLLESLGRSAQNVPIKLSHDPVFAYFDKERHWSAVFAHLRSYETIAHADYRQYMDCTYPLFGRLVGSTHNNEPLPQCNSLTDSQSRLAQLSQKYMYVGFAQMNSWLESFAPSLGLLAQSLLIKYPLAQTNLWLATANVTAHMHYDLQDNFLLQLAGNKTVTIVSPEGLHYLRPFPSLHPLWRQSSLSPDALTLDSLLSAAVATTPLSVGSKDGAAVHGHRQSDEQIINQLYNTSFMVWQTTLSPGQALYIPAGFYHTVSTPADSVESVSINTWYPSPLADFYQRLQRVDLPFDLTHDTRTQQVSNLIAVMMNLCQLWGMTSRDCLLDALQDRHASVLAVDEAQSCPVEDAREEILCSAQSIQLAGMLHGLIR